MKISLWELQEALRKKNGMRGFEPVLIASADFANGTKFEVHLVNKRGACRITNVDTGKTGHAHNVENAWASIRYQARITWKTQRSS